MVRIVTAFVAAVLAAGLAPATTQADPYFLGVDLDLYPPPLIAPPPLIPAPQVKQGCKRLWRCDANVCEWRRGCWGVYGYVEGPYYTSAYARRQYETHGWPAKRGVAVAPPPGVLVGPPPGDVAVRAPAVIIPPTVVVTPPPVIATPVEEVVVAPPPRARAAPKVRTYQAPPDPRDK